MRKEQKVTDDDKTGIDDDVADELKTVSTSGATRGL